MSKISVINLLASSGYLVVNKHLAKKVGISAAVLMAELCSEHLYWKNLNKLTEDGFFYSTVENVTEQTTLSEYEQQKAIKKLQSLNLLVSERRGLPAKRHIRINEEELSNLFLEKPLNYQAAEPPKTPSSQKTTELDPKEFGSNNNNIINNNTHTISKDIVFDTQTASPPVPSSKTSSSKKPLFDAQDCNTTETKKDKSFRNAKERIIAAYCFSPEVVGELQDHLTSLVQTKTYLSDIAFEKQLDLLVNLTDAEKLSVIRKTVTSGWKSLSYAADDLKKQGKPKFDTAVDSQNQFKDPKNDTRKERYMGQEEF